MSSEDLSDDHREEGDFKKLSWSNRTPTFKRTVGALFKKTWLLKIRRPAAIVEFVLACLIIFPLYPVYILAQQDYDGSNDPPIEWANDTFVDPNHTGLLAGMAIYEDSKFILLPVSGLQEYLIGPAFNQMFSSLNEKLGTNYKVQYMDDVSKMEDEIYSSDATGIGVHWPNSKDVSFFLPGDFNASDRSDILEFLDGTSNLSAVLDVLQNPKFEVFEQSLTNLMGGGSLADIMYMLRMAMVPVMKLTGGMIANNVTQTENEASVVKAFASVVKAENISGSSWGLQTYATQSTTQYFEIHIAVIFFGVLPVILSVMPDFQTVLEEKDTKVAALTFLMGCSETAYWLVNFLMPFFLSVPPYLLWSVMITQWFGMKGTDFFLMFVICLLFVIGHIWFIFFLSSFMKKGSAGRSVTILLLVLCIFFGFLHQYFTLDENNSSTAVKHVFSIVPLSAFELTLMAMYTEAMNSQPPFKWKDINRDIVYPPYYGIVWLIVDAILYFLLFVLMNLTMPRQFGTPPLGWGNLFSLKAWKRMLKEDNNSIGQLNTEVSDFLEVKGLGKIYHGDKDVKALEDVEFKIHTGEVIVVIGPNGAGKSTLVNIIAGATEPSTGTMSLLGGLETTRFTDIQRYLGVVFQDNVIINLLSVREHMYLFGAFRGIPIDVLEESIEFYAHTLQLTHMLENRAGDLSGGQKRKLCISLSLLGNPPIVIMDEPTAGVDVQARQLIWKTIASLECTTSLITSHALEEAEAVSSRLFIVSQGHLPFCGTSTELRNKYQCGYLLRIQGNDNTMQQVLELAQSLIPAARMIEDRKDTIAMPVDAAVPHFLNCLQDKAQEYGVVSYSFAVEQLEDMLLKLIQTDEAAYGVGK